MDGNQERSTNETEKSPEQYIPDIEQHESISNNTESSAELSPRDLEARAEKARAEALEKAISVEAGGKEKEKKQPSSTRRGSIGKKQLEKSYKQTLKQIQVEMPVANRVFSKVIHNKFIEKSSDIVGSTIARPNAILAGAFMAFILTLLAYTVAKTIGYNLSGFETIAAFIIGWVIGIVYDYLRVLITGKRI